MKDRREKRQTERSARERFELDFACDEEPDYAGHAHNTENSEGLVARIGVRHDRQEDRATG